MENILSLEKKYELLFAFNKVRKEFRNEKILILFMIKHDLNIKYCKYRIYEVYY